MSDYIGYATYGQGSSALHGELGIDIDGRYFILYVPSIGDDGKIAKERRKFVIMNGCFEMLEQEEYITRLRIQYRQSQRDAMPQPRPIPPKPKTEAEELRDTIANLTALVMQRNSQPAYVHPATQNLHSTQQPPANVVAIKPDWAQDPRAEIEKAKWAERAQNPTADSGSPWDANNRMKPAPDPYTLDVPRNMIGYQLIEGSSAKHFGNSDQLPTKVPTFEGPQQHPDFTNEVEGSMN